MGWGNCVPEGCYSCNSSCQNNCEEWKGYLKCSNDYCNMKSCSEACRRFWVSTSKVDLCLKCSCRPPSVDVMLNDDGSSNGKPASCLTEIERVEIKEKGLDNLVKYIGTFIDKQHDLPEVMKKLNEYHEMQLKTKSDTILADED